MCGVSTIITDKMIMSNNIIVSTGDIKSDYEIIGPVYFSVSNKGLFGSQLGTLIGKNGQTDHLFPV
jgi:hypothetical protein